MTCAWQSHTGRTQRMALQFLRIASASNGGECGTSARAGIDSAHDDMRGIHLNDVGSELAMDFQSNAKEPRPISIIAMTAAMPMMYAQTREQGPHHVPAQRAQRHSGCSLKRAHASPPDG